MKALKKFTIWTLMLLLGFSLIPPVPVVASAVVENSEIEPAPPKEGKIELKNKRTQNTKIYLKSDGTKEAVVHQDAIHFEKNEFGKKVFEDIDYGLSDKDPLFGIITGNEFKNKKNSFDLNISKNISKNAFSLKKNDTEITMGVSDVRSPKQNKSLLDINKLKSLAYEQKDNSVKYKNVTPGVDYTFYSMPDGVKEYITINKYSGQNEFSYNFTLKNGYILSDKDGSYKIYNSKTKAEVFTMPRFFMWDSKSGKDHIDNAYSYDVKTSIVETKKNNYKLVVTADDKWLSDKSRVFPIYLDPSYSTYSGEDTYVQSGYPTTRAWDQRALYLGVGASKGVNRALVKFDLPDLRGARIDYAQFDVYQYGNCSGSCTWSNVNAYTTGWFNPWDVHWYNQPGLWSHVGVGRQTAAWGWLSMGVTGAVQQWFPNYASYGGSHNGALAFYQSVENSWGFRTWASRNNPDYNWGQPRLTINYNDYKASYNPTTVSEGIAGTTIDVPVGLFNNGRNTWYKGGANPTKISSHLVNNATGEEVFWEGARGSLPYDIARGGSGTAIAKVKLPPVSGSYTIKFELVHEGITWFSHQGVATANRTISVYPPSFASMNRLGQESYYAMAGPVELSSGNLSYSSTDLSVPSNTGGLSMSRSYNSNRNFTTFNHDASGYIRTWLHNGPYKNNTQATRLSQSYLVNEGLVRPNSYSTSQNNLWLPGSEPNTSYMHYDWIFEGAGAYQRGRANNVAAYSHIYVYSPNTRTVSLRMGSDDGIKAWLNGELVHNNDIYRGLTLDSDIKTVNLNIGWNSLMVKTSQATSGWHMSARFLSQSGAVMNDLKYSVNNPELFEKSGVLGPNWVTGFEERLFTVNPEDIYYTDATGTVNQYIGTGGGNYTKPAGTELILTKSSTNYTITSKSGVQRVFDLGGRLLEIRDLSGNKINYQYNTAGKVEKLTDLGRELNFVYNQDGTLASTFNAAGQSIVYNYENGRLSRVIDNDGFSFKYSYDSEGRITEYVDKKDNSTKVEYSGGRVIRVINAQNQTTSFVYSSAKTEVIDALGRKTTYTFDSANLVSTSTDAKNYTEKYIHDKRYNRVAMLPEFSTTDPDYYEYRYEYDASDNQVKETDPLGSITAYQYLGNDLTRVTDPKGGVVENTYSTDGRRLLLSEKDAEGNISRYEYDGLGRKIANITSKGERTTSVFNNFSDLVSVTSPKNETTSFEYDSLGRKIKDISPLGKENLYIYDVLSQLVKITAPGEIETMYKYDPNGNKVEENLPGGGQKIWVYDALDRNIEFREKIAEGEYATTKYEYDAVGNKAKQIDAKGKATAYEYDVLNQLVKETDATGASSTVGYNKNGEAVSVVDTKGQTTAQTYDKAGQVTREVTPEGTTNLTYDKNGNVTTLSNPKETLNVTYDKNDAPVVESSSQTGSVTRTYDVNQEQTKVETTNAKTEFTLDANGQVVEVKSTVVGASSAGGCAPGQFCPLATIPTVSGMANFDRDQEGKLVGISKANGNIVSYGYDSAGRVNSLTTTNKDGNILASFAYTYDAASNQTKITDNKGRSFDYEYDLRNQLKKDNLAGYSYDVVGNRTQMITTEGVVNYTYDEGQFGNRLLRVDYPNGRVVSFEYDKNGNATKKTDSTKGVTSYKYDSDDYFIEALLPDGTKVEYTYDEVEKRRSQRKVTRPNGTVEILKFTFDGDKLMTETDTAGKIVRSYTWDENENLISVAMPDASGILKYFYFVKNAKGDILGLSDENGKLVAEYEYDSWGNILSSVTLDSTLGTDFAKTNPRLYASYWYDQDLGQYFMKARMYDPELGRFYSQDPIEAEDSTLSQNPYTYCDNNPIMKIDPDGKIAFVPILLIGLSIWYAYDDLKTLTNKKASKSDKRWAMVGLGLTFVPGDEVVRGGLKGAKYAPKVANKVHDARRYAVYQGVNRQGQTYFGRTNNFPRRYNEHLKNGITSRPIMSKITYSQSRGLEQILINKSGGVNKLLNMRNGVSKLNKNYHKYMGEGRKIYKKVRGRK